MTDDGFDRDGEDDDADDHADDHADDEGGVTRPGPAAAYAPNWKTVLAVDASIGLVVLVAGVAGAIAWNPLAGGFVGSLGFVYVAFVARRARDWQALRRDAGQ